jgi:hypothetical protein
LVGVQVLNTRINANINVLIDIARVVSIQLKISPDWRTKPTVHSKPIVVSYYFGEGSPVLARARGKWYQAVVKLPLSVGR